MLIELMFPILMVESPDGAWIFIMGSVEDCPHDARTSHVRARRRCVHNVIEDNYAWLRLERREARKEPKYGRC